MASKLSRLVRRGWAKSPAAGSSTKSATGQATGAGGPGVAASLDATDASRMAALLRLSATEGQEAGSPALPASSPAGSATVDLADALSSQPGSTSVNQPRRQRRSWGPTPGSAEPRRSLSALEVSCTFGIGGAEAAEEAARPHSVLGCEQAQPSPDAFSVYQSAGSAQGTPLSDAAAASGSQSSRSRRLSFSFGGGPRRAAARTAAQVTLDERLFVSCGALPAVCTSAWWVEVASFVRI